MMKLNMEEVKQISGHWLCLSCNKSDGVTNGICSRCGAVQTKPISEEAMDEADVTGSKDQKGILERKKALEAKERDDHSRKVANGEAKVNHT